MFDYAENTNSARLSVIGRVLFLYQVANPPPNPERLSWSHEPGTG